VSQHSIIQNFRQKFPDYNDLSDQEVADALAKRYPEAYGDITKAVKTRRGFKVEAKEPAPDTPLPKTGAGFLERIGTTLQAKISGEQAVAPEMLRQAVELGPGLATGAAPLKTIARGISRVPGLKSVGRFAQKNLPAVRAGLESLAFGGGAAATGQSTGEVITAAVLPAGGRLISHMALGNTRVAKVLKQEKFTELLDEFPARIAKTDRAGNSFTQTKEQLYKLADSMGTKIALNQAKEAARRGIGQGRLGLQRAQVPKIQSALKEVEERGVTRLKQFGPTVTRTEPVTFQETTTIIQDLNDLLYRSSIRESKRGLAKLRRVREGVWKDIIQAGELAPGGSAARVFKKAQEISQREIASSELMEILAVATKPIAGTAIETINPTQVLRLVKANLRRSGILKRALSEGEQKEVLSLVSRYIDALPSKGGASPIVSLGFMGGAAIGAGIAGKTALESGFGGGAAAGAAGTAAVIGGLTGIRVQEGMANLMLTRGGRAFFKRYLDAGHPMSALPGAAMNFLRVELTGE